MFTNSYKGTFKAFEPHDNLTEDTLRVEMQQLADTANLAEKKRGIPFEHAIAEGLEALNIRYNKTNRRYEAYAFYKDEAFVHVVEYKKEPNSCNDGFWMPTTIGDYRIIRNS